MTERQWAGKWIWAEREAAGGAGNESVFFRRAFTVPDAECRLLVRLTGDSRYRFSINGQQIVFGPAKGDDHIHYYDSVDLSAYLEPGANVLTAWVLHYAPGGSLAGPLSIGRSYRGAFLLDGELEDRQGATLETLHTDERWRCTRDASYALVYESYMSGNWLGGIEQVDGALVPCGWQSPSFDDTAWPPAVAVMETSNPFGLIGPWRLAPRTIPFLYEEERYFKTVKRASGVADRGEPLIRFFARGGDAGAPLVVPPRSRLYVELDAGVLTTGFLRAEWTGGAGARLSYQCAECYEGTNADGSRRKGVRDDSSAGQLLRGDSDRYAAAGSGRDPALPESYEPFWFRTFRFVALCIETADEPLRLSRFLYRETGYPLKVDTTFECSDPRLKPLWDISLNTLQRCMHETYEDCPFYEQLQYTMDTRLEMLYHISISRDARLGRKAIVHFHHSRLPSGMLQCRYPSSEPQVIPAFALYWIMMLRDYVLYFGDDGLLRECRATVDGVLEWFDDRLTPEGLVGPAPAEYWSYIDWVRGWPVGVPPAAEQGPLTVVSLMYAVALEEAAQLMAWSGRPGLAAEYEARSASILQAVRSRCWSEERALYRDGPAVESYSQHAQIWAVLAGAASAEEAGPLMDRMLADASLDKASYSMSFFLFRALSRAGRYERTYALWKDWEDMAALNLTTWAEDAIDQRSDCHGWGALPLYEFPSELLGVRPSAPGYAEIAIEPKPGSLDWAKGSVATANGPVQVVWTAEGGRFKVDVDGPAGIPVRLVLPGRNPAPVRICGQPHGGLSIRAAAGRRSEMNPISLEQISPGGDLRDRLRASASRLADNLYGPAEVFKPATYDWPGDNEGRTLLGQILTARALGEAPVHTGAILAALPDCLNERGYFGRILPAGVTDEQQLSGNSWYVRALAELYVWRRDPEALRAIERVVRGLLLPARQHFEHYPVDPHLRASDGEAAGKLSERTVQDWYLSTDIGCAFIMLDGAAHAYELLPLPELKETIDAMIRRFLAIDLSGIHAQTHATLSALRGILRYQRIVEDPYLLDEAERIFGLYIREGMTANFANRNWFGRPWWTEPCAVVDAFICATELWSRTSKPEYVDIAHLIYFNALGHGQRANGGFGCDNCAGATERELYALENVYEASWCCTMRGGEGLARAAEYGFWVGGHRVDVPFYHDSVVRLSLPGGEASIRQTTSYPYEGRTVLEVLDAPEEGCGIELGLYLPRYAKSGSASVRIDGCRQETAETDGFLVLTATLRPGMRLELQFELELVRVPVAAGFPNATALRHGPLLLQRSPGEAEEPGPATVHAGEGVYEDGAGNPVLSPVYRAIRDVDRAWLLRQKTIVFD